jgi:hypothetical protein
MRDETRHGDGVRFAYSPRASRVALIIRGSTVVTVVTRDMYGRARPSINRPERRYERRQHREDGRRRPRRRRRRQARER